MLHLQRLLKPNSTAAAAVLPRKGYCCCCCSLKRSSESWQQQKQTRSSKTTGRSSKLRQHPLQQNPQQQQQQQQQHQQRMHLVYPAPSPITNPDLFLSKGRHASFGLSLKPRANALRALNPANDSRVIDASAPPHNTISASPDCSVQTPQQTLLLLLLLLLLLQVLQQQHNKPSRENEYRVIYWKRHHPMQKGI